MTTLKEQIEITARNTKYRGEHKYKKFFIDYQEHPNYEIYKATDQGKDMVSASMLFSGLVRAIFPVAFNWSVPLFIIVGAQGIGKTQMFHSLGVTEYVIEISNFAAYNPVELHNPSVNKIFILKHILKFLSLYPFKSNPKR